MNLATFTDAQITDLQAALMAEVERRRAEPLVDRARTELVTTLRDQGTLTPPDAATSDTPPEQVPAWADPGTDHTRMYTAGQVVAHGGRIWESTHPGLNHWEPSPAAHAAWRDVTPAEDPDAPIPYEDGRHYTAGQVVEFDSVEYECLIDHFAAPGWTPVNAHANWRKM